jgi:lipoprotein-anchoring transpeptidase ErfK/SrfK
VNVAQRVALAALVVGLVIVGGVDLLHRGGSTVRAVAAAEQGSGGTADAANRTASTAGAANTAAVGTTATSAAATDDAVDDVADTPNEAPPSTGDSVAPPQLPANSGAGMRMVYTVSGHRVWAVDASNNVVRTMLVTGRKFVPSPGTYHVFGKARNSRSKFFPEITMEYMTRFAISPNKKNTIGFHQIPLKNGVPMQTVDQLGSYGSGGCVRMKADDAIFTFNWATMGTKVVVLA